MRISFFRFVNLRFTVEEGATLVFDMPITRFGPNNPVSFSGTLRTSCFDESDTVLIPHVAAVRRVSFCEVFAKEHRQKR